MGAKDRDSLKTFVKSLDQTERHVLLMHYVDRLSPREISRVLELAMEQVVHMIARLRERFRGFVASLNTQPDVSAIA